MQRGRGPRSVFIWGNGNQAAHKAAPRRLRPLRPCRRLSGLIAQAVQTRSGGRVVSGPEQKAVNLGTLHGPSLGSHAQLVLIEFVIVRE